MIVLIIYKSPESYFCIFLPFMLS